MKTAVYCYDLGLKHSLSLQIGTWKTAVYCYDLGLKHSLSLQIGT
jgi:hypothetical protein